MANRTKLDEGALNGKECKKSSIKLLCQSALVKLIFFGLVEPKAAFESFIGLADSRMASHLDKVVFLGLFIYFSYKVSSSIDKFQQQEIVFIFTIKIVPPKHCL